MNRPQLEFLVNTHFRSYTQPVIVDFIAAYNQSVNLMLLRLIVWFIASEQNDRRRKAIRTSRTIKNAQKMYIYYYCCNTREKKIVTEA